MPELEKIGNISPLLGEAVIERDYTKSIEGQLGDGTIPEPGKTNGQDYKTPEPGQYGPQSGQGPTSDFDGPKNFAFEEEMQDKSDIHGDEEPGFNLASTSAKTFANVVGDLIKTKVPEITYQICKIDTNSIEVHIQNGNINAGLRDIFFKINEGTREALDFSDDEIKMWKKAFKEYLEYNNIKAANPNTAFYLATGVLAFTHYSKVRELSRTNKQYIVDAINSYNPGYFDSFRAKTGTAPEKEDGVKKDETITDKAEL